MYKTINGMKDTLPDEIHRWHYLEDIAREVFSNYHYKEVRTPVLEKTELFKRGVGETTDIVEKEMYTFADRNGKSLSLRPEGTASVVRAFIQGKLYASNHVNKLFYSGEMYRHERPQKGRLRSFHQIGAEYFGATSYLCDLEMIMMIAAFLKRLGLADYSFYINSIGCKACRPGYKEALIAYFTPRIESLCPNCQRRIETNPLRILDCKNKGCQEQAIDAPVITDHLCEGCETHHNNLVEKLDQMGVRYVVDPKIVRGLDYYERTTFEVRVAGDLLGSQNTILGGGRYNGLVKQLEGPATEAIGFAMGVERMIFLLEHLESKPKLDYAVIPLGDAAITPAFKIIEQLRTAGNSVDFDPRLQSLKSQMRWANKMGAQKVIILGEQELNEGYYIEKDMVASTQKQIPLK